jgi:ABC-2 type transport system permease protein
MMASIRYTQLRLWAMLKKELIVIRRDYVTYLFIILIPFFQLILFGYVIQTDPKHLPTVVVTYDSSPFTNDIIMAFKNTDYFTITNITHDTQQANHLLKNGNTQFVITIPENFTHDLIKNKHPHLLIEGDGTDPIAVSNAFNAAKNIVDSALYNDVQGELRYLTSKDQSFIVDTHANYNPALLAQYHTLPGLIATLITITLTMLTAISITSELESGTMEILLITPIKSLEVIIGKIIPHLLLGYTLFFLALMISHWIFHVPIYGSLLLLTLVSLPFFIANLEVGLFVSTISKTQFRAANLANTYNLPVVLFSGFMFPFYGMPHWAQWIGELFPNTHYIRILIDVMLKDDGFSEIWPDLWPILLFVVILLIITIRKFRRTLD